MNTGKFLNYEYLKENAIREPSYFGLGFIHLKLPDDMRMQFYHPDLDVLVNDPHDHRDSFTSHILQGTMVQTVYEFKPHELGRYQLSHEDCDPNTPPSTAVSDPGNISKLVTFTSPAGTHYQISNAALHSVEPVDTGDPRKNCVTLMQRYDIPGRAYANVAVNMDAAKVCPYSTPMSVETCWKLIAEMLPEHGYHVTEIAKGEIGEPSKIIEEACELQDAHDQDIKIMAKVEMSDVYGALEKYRETHHPDVSMNDIIEMHTATQRAFKNGYR